MTALFQLPNETISINRDVHGVFHDLPQFRFHNVRIGEKEGLHPPLHLLFEFALADVPDINPPKPPHRRRRIARPHTPQPTEISPPLVGLKEVTFELLRRLRVASSLAQAPKLGGIATGPQHKPAIATLQMAADRTQETIAFEFSQAPLAGRMMTLDLMRLPSRLQGHHEVHLLELRVFDADRHSLTAQHANALRHRAQPFVPISPLGRGPARKGHGRSFGAEPILWIAPMACRRSRTPITSAPPSGPARAEPTPQRAPKLDPVRSARDRIPRRHNGTRPRRE